MELRGESALARLERAQAARGGVEVSLGAASSAAASLSAAAGGCFFFRFGSFAGVHAAPAVRDGEASSRATLSGGLAAGAASAHRSV